MSCKYFDPACPCNDGDMCHYEGPNPMQPKGKFEVIVNLHTREAFAVMTDPGMVRMLIGEALDKNPRLQEEIDYTLEVRRIYQ